MRTMGCSATHSGFARQGAAHRPVVGAAAGALVATLLLAGCGTTSNSAEVYVEDLGDDGLRESRAYAYRITVFEYSHEVGGFVEFFAVDGSVNTPTNPYFRSTDCAYFGEGRLRNDQFPVDVEGVDGTPFRMTVDVLSRRNELLGTITSPGGTWPAEVPFPAEGVTLRLVRDDVPPERRCAE